MKDEPYFARPKNGRTEAERVAASLTEMADTGNALRLGWSLQLRQAASALTSARDVVIQEVLDALHERLAYPTEACAIVRAILRTKESDNAG